MSKEKEDPIFAMAIDRCSEATQGRDLVINLALGLKLFIEGIRRRQTQPPNSLFRMAIDHCAQAAAPGKMVDEVRLAHVANALQQFIAAVR
jgi:hypothetical protein